MCVCLSCCSVTLEEDHRREDGHHLLFACSFNHAHAYAPSTKTGHGGAAHGALDFTGIISIERLAGASPVHHAGMRLHEVGHRHRANVHRDG